MANGKGGRPRIDINLEELAKLAAMQCTDEEIAAFFNVSLDTIKKRKTNGGEFATVYKKAKEAGRSSLRRLQWQSAQNGNITMQIWLGKQLLGQRDTVEQQMTLSGTVKHQHEVIKFEPSDIADALQALLECGAVQVRNN